MNSQVSSPEGTIRRDGDVPGFRTSLREDSCPALIPKIRITNHNKQSEHLSPISLIVYCDVVIFDSVEHVVLQQSSSQRTMADPVRFPVPRIVLGDDT